MPAASHGGSRKVSERVVLACRKLATLKGGASEERESKEGRKKGGMEKEFYETRARWFD